MSGKYLKKINPKVKRETNGEFECVKCYKNDSNTTCPFCHA